MTYLCRPKPGNLIQEAWNPAGILSESRKKLVKIRGVAEWSIAAVLKTVEPRGSGVRIPPPLLLVNQMFRKAPNFSD